MEAIISLNIAKGVKTWIAKVDETFTPIKFINNSKFKKEERGVLDFFIKEAGIYKAHDTNGTVLYHCFLNGNNELEAVEISKKEAIKEFIFLSDLKMKKINFRFGTSKNAYTTNWIRNFNPICDTELGEDENFYYISGKFYVKTEKYKRNNYIPEIFEKEVTLVKERYSKKDGYLKIINNDTEEIIFETSEE
ncbi:MAG: hypothetical protein RBS42_06620 [Campylobacterales bacterium]|jgi:hypothetical protein|nr:hypothetical protein [Campylobacterales bacterium]